MDMGVKFPEEYRHRNKRENYNPSFSSTLLDSIYRSIDDQSNGSKVDKELFFTTTMAKKHNNNNNNRNKDEILTSLQRACMIEKWMERRKPTADSQRNSRNDQFDPVFLNSSSTSSDSSSGVGGFSSSESDSFHGVKSSRSSSSTSTHYTTHRPKPIRTGVSSRPPPVEVLETPKYEADGFVRTKSKALKIYSDLKKVKQPISPGGRLASFLNSLFTTGNTKKTKIPSSKSDKTTTTTTTPTCSSASSYSRSCLSKTPSTTRGHSTTKRSVRFCPVNVILDDDNTRHENNTSNKSEPTSKEIEFRIMEENRRVVEAAKDLLKSYRKKKEEDDMREICIVDDVSTDDGVDGDDDDEDDDTASYASSDLFELNNLSAIGVERYREELPVYETTNYLDTNRAIANGLFV